jgi:hypothetical protein
MLSAEFGVRNAEWPDWTSSQLGHLKWLISRIWGGKIPNHGWTRMNTDAESSWQRL